MATGIPACLPLSTLLAIEDCVPIGMWPNVPGTADSDVNPVQAIDPSMEFDWGALADLRRGSDY
jgi:hypothetical protein